MLLEQLFARFEECQLQEALDTIALDASAKCLVHVRAHVLRVKEQGIEERWDQRVTSDQHGLVNIYSLTAFSQQCLQRP